VPTQVHPRDIQGKAAGEAGEGDLGTAKSERVELGELEGSTQELVKPLAAVDEGINGREAPRHAPGMWATQRARKKPRGIGRHV